MIGQLYPATLLARIAEQIGRTTFCEIVYVDHSSNAMTGLRAAMLPPNARLPRRSGVGARGTFSDRQLGTAFLYENSNGLAEIAVDQGHSG